MTPQSTNRLIISLSFLAFISLGLPDVVLGVAWPSLRTDLHRPLSHLGVLVAAGTAGYLVSSFSGGTLVRVLGVGRLLVASCLLVVLGLGGIALSPWWWATVACSTVGGLGAGAIDGGINAFAAARFSPRVVNWLHACWGIGATTGPLLMTAVIVGGWGWRAGYAILAAVMLALSFLFMSTLRLWTSNPSDPSHPDHPDHPASTGNAPTLLEALRRRAIWLQMTLYFCYTGAEAAAGQWLFSLLTESRGVSVAVAGTVVGGYWASLTAGRIAFGQLSTVARPVTVLRAGMTLAPIAAALLWWGPTPAVTFAAVALLGFGFAPVFPTLVSVTPDRVGPRFAAHSIGFQMAAATLGIAIWPGLVGVVARQTSLEVLGAYLTAATLALFFFHELTVRATRATAPRPDAVAEHSP